MKSFCLLIPTYNNEKTVGRVVREILRSYPDVIVVNDGSTDKTAAELEKIDGIHLVSYAKNRGKGFALRQGFKKAHSLGFEYAITIDSDGQHEPKNIADMVSAIPEQGENPVLLMGNRNMNQAGIPKKSSFGNKFSNFWFWVETGEKLSDTQTGFRAYPVAPINKMRWFTNRFEFEIEVIVRLSWRGIPIHEVPVLVNYPEDRVSHFRPFADFARISVLNTVLVLLTALFYAPKRIFFGKGEKSLKNRLSREFSKHSGHKIKMSASVGMGLFFGIFPIWGFQMVAGFAAASAFKLNRVVVLAFSNISIPPMIPFIIYGSYFVGGKLLGTSVALPEISAISLDDIYLQLKQYLIGAILLSIGAAVVGYFVTYLIMAFGARQKKN